MSDKLVCCLYYLSYFLVTSSCLCLACVKCRSPVLAPEFDQSVYTYVNKSSSGTAKVPKVGVP